MTKELVTVDEFYDRATTLETAYDILVRVASTYHYMELPGSHNWGEFIPYLLDKTQTTDLFQTFEVEDGERYGLGRSLASVLNHYSVELRNYSNYQRWIWHESGDTLRTLQFLEAHAVEIVSALLTTLGKCTGQDRHSIIAWTLTMCQMEDLPADILSQIHIKSNLVWLGGQFEDYATLALPEEGETYNDLLRVFKDTPHTSDFAKIFTGRWANSRRISMSVPSNLSLPIDEARYQAQCNDSWTYRLDDFFSMELKNEFIQLVRLGKHFYLGLRYNILTAKDVTSYEMKYIYHYETFLSRGFLLEKAKEVIGDQLLVNSSNMVGNLQLAGCTLLYLPEDRILRTIGQEGRVLQKGQGLIQVIEEGSWKDADTQLYTSLFLEDTRKPRNTFKHREDEVIDMLHHYYMVARQGEHRITYAGSPMSTLFGSQLETIATDLLYILLYGMTHSSVEPMYYYFEHVIKRPQPVLTDKPALEVATFTDKEWDNLLFPFGRSTEASMDSYQMIEDGFNQLRKDI